VDVHQLVRAIAREVLRQLGVAGDKPCVLVLADRDAALAARVLDRLGEDADVLFAGEDAGGREPARRILPLLSCADMAQLAAGGAAGPAPALVLPLLLAGREVEVLEFEYRAWRETAPQALYALYEAHEKTLASFGLRELRSTRPGTFTLREDVVTEQAVLLAHGQGAAVLLAPETAKVTPLAAETAKTLNIAIRKRP